MNLVTIHLDNAEISLRMRSRAADQLIQDWNGAKNAPGYYDPLTILRGRPSDNDGDGDTVQVVVDLYRIQAIEMVLTPEQARVEIGNIFSKNSVLTT